MLQEDLFTSLAWAAQKKPQKTTPNQYHGLEAVSPKNARRIAKYRKKRQATAHLTFHKEQINSLSSVLEKEKQEKTKLRDHMGVLQDHVALYKQRFDNLLMQNNAKKALPASSPKLHSIHALEQQLNRVEHMLVSLISKDSLTSQQETALRSHIASLQKTVAQKKEHLLMHTSESSA